jgi:hypothetical protein
MSNTYYIIDSTAKQNGKSPVILFNTTAGVITRLEEMCKKKFGKSRKDYMYSVSELGFGEDDGEGQSFFEQMEQYFNMGVIRNDSVPMKCNIFQAKQFAKGKAEYGN